MGIKKYFHKWAWSILVVFCLVGIFYPVIGIIAIICMLAPVVVSIFKGRYWCGNFCPRGSFNDILLSKVSRRNRAPEFLKAKRFKYLFLMLLMSGFAIQLYFAWGSISSVGAVFVRMILITTLLSVFLGTVYNQRTWCTICPMGTLASYVASAKTINKRIKHVTFSKEKCVNCNLCTRSCPMGIDVLGYKDNVKVNHADCIKCGICIGKCPKDSLNIA